MNEVSSGSIARVRELERLALARLPDMQRADGVFCHEVSAHGGGRATGRSLRHTLVVLIGLLRTEEHGIEHPFHIGALRAKLLSELGAEELTAGDFGLALWAESRTDGGATEQLLSGLERRLVRSGGPERLATLEAAWILSGLVESGARADLGAREQLLREVRAELVERRLLDSGLLAHVGRGRRRRYPTFADQICGLLALSQLSRTMDDAEAREATARLAAKLVELQMPNGAWPWLLDATKGAVVDPYPVYSAHQDSIALAGLHGASEATATPRFREAALRGMDWNYGENELGAQMVDAEAGIVHRSIRRKRRRGSEARSVAAGYLRARYAPASPDALEVERAMRPYHLGWILEAWAGREELAGRTETSSQSPP